jgi:hypothetical protein
MRAVTGRVHLKHWELVEHAIRVCGEDHVGIGSDCSITPLMITEDYRRTWHDFVSERMRLGIAAPGEDPNVFPFVPDFNSPRRLELIAQRQNGDYGSTHGQKSGGPPGAERRRVFLAHARPPTVFASLASDARTA